MKHVSPASRRLAVSTSSLLAALSAGALVSYALAEDAPASPDAARRALAVARYTGGEVTIGEIEDSIAVSSPLAQTRAREPAHLKELLDKNLRQELLAIEAEGRGYGKNPKVVQAVKDNAIQRMVAHDIEANVNPQSLPAADIQKYYEEHRSDYARPELRRASQLSVATEAEARALLPRVRSTDTKAFRELVREKSTDEQDKRRGGDLGYFDASGKTEGSGSQVETKVAGAVFALKAVGDVSDVIKTPAGFAVVKLTGIQAPHSTSLEQAQGRIRTRLAQTQRQAALDALVTQRRTEVNPVVHAELIDAVQIDPGTNAEGATVR